MATSTGGFAGMFQGLGWSFGKTKAEKKEEKDIQQQEVVEIENNDASEIIDSTHSSRSVMGALESFKTQAAIVNEYRSMSLHPEVDNAVDDIVNAIVSVDDEEAPVKIDISNSTLSENTKQIINERFEDLLRKMRFDVTAYEKVKQWYVDGRLVYHVVINPDKPKEGIQKLILLDPRAVKRVKEIKKEPDENGVDRVIEVEDYFIYDGTYSYDNTQNKVAVNGSKFQNASNTFGKQAQKLKMSKDSIAMVIQAS